MSTRSSPKCKKRPSRGRRIYFKTTSYPFSLVITQSWTDVYGHPVRFQLVSALDLPHEFWGRSDRECQDLRSADLVSRDLPGLRLG
ncbi:hypothetical protein Prudu_60S000100 [Prunus dulcis]|uniref:Uncharacterized protein n=1 Tax=Prunus dulcis TaxID=3755 RepID=A0A5H2XWK3_PRUDU|nr:hypothetical protein Prudu_60S000100 [Prunus dulcis]